MSTVYRFNEIFWISIPYNDLVICKDSPDYLLFLTLNPKLCRGVAKGTLSRKNEN